MRMLFSFLVVVLVTSVGRAETPEDVFTKRILPIFQSPNPSSCVQCHLSGVDLKDYIRPSHRETFLSLRDQGLIDLDHPEKSKILHLIDMGNREKSATVIQKKNRVAEHEAFAGWIVVSAKDAELRNAPKLKTADIAKPTRPDAVIRHARKDRILETFENSVWAMRFRCAGCHTEAGVVERKKKKPDEEHGKHMAWIRGTAEETFTYLANSRLMNTTNPEKSLLLQKPLNDDVKHGGGVKFVVGDEGYKAYRGFLEDYAKVVKNQYTKADELPKPEKIARFGTEAWFKIQNTPPAWADKVVSVTLFPWDATKNDWAKEPIATTDRRVWGGGKLWQHTLVLKAPADSEQAKAWRKTPPKMQPGKYLVKVYLDAEGRLEKDWHAELGEKEFVGQAVVESQWPTGYGKMTVLEASQVKKP